MSYTRLFGRPPDFTPHVDFVEWEIVDGRTWFQLGRESRGPCGSAWTTSTPRSAGFYQRLFDETPAVPGGRERDRAHASQR